jgi:hypothetical protein
MTSSQGQQTMQKQPQQTQTMPQGSPTEGSAGTGEDLEDLPTLQPPGLTPTAGSVSINLENDLFLIGNSVINLLGKVNTLQFENGLDKEVTIQIVIGYPVDSPTK